MSVTSIVHTRYQKLCMKLGDVVRKRDELQSEVDSIKAEITALQSLLPDLEQYEKAQAAQKSVNEQT